ncbi:ArsR family transcriptional regulator [Methanoregula sp.]|uniref:ArsR family transcriptional regulator n=1 Tax=Methanoregula sp. TaxID=2052170 RepID=UPI002C281DAD|nr:ArsR family transcriptional regulator [Methanoregula sp.]HVP96795.1 ArsR family transcriptional regulator [Methanoregula sp.]
MRTERLVYFSAEEEEFANLLIGIGLRKNIAKVLVFLANHPEASSRAVERGADMRQPEVSLVMRALMDYGWISSRETRFESRGRPVCMYRLAKPLPEIMDCIESEKRKEATDRLAMIQRLRSFV